MSLLVATWTGSIATVGLLAGAGITAWYARKAFREQAEQVIILREQADRDIDQRRRDQATRVFAWTEQRPFDGDPADPRAAACVRNTSQQAVYDVRLGWGTSGQHRWPVLLPGGECLIPGAGSSVADGTSAVWAEFRDAQGIRWRTSSTGNLDPM